MTGSDVRSCIATGHFVIPSPAGFTWSPTWGDGRSTIESQTGGIYIAAATISGAWIHPNIAGKMEGILLAM